MTKSASGYLYSALFAGFLGLLACSAAHAETWERHYVASWYEPAFYYDPDDANATSGEAPGKDCADGFSPYPDYYTLLETSYRTKEEVEYFLDPQRRSEPGFDRRTYGLRGPNGEYVYEEPWTVPDVPYPLPTSKIAEGFNLDGDESTGYTSPEGVKGVDNAFYTVGGCVGYWRGPVRGSDGFKYSNEDMHNGDFSIVITLSGEGEPLSDGPATLSFAVSKDVLVRDAKGNIAHDYTFRIDTEQPEQGSTHDVMIENGKVRIAQPSLVQMKDWKHRYPLILEQAQFEFDLQEDGTIEGLVGGYRHWNDHYRFFARAIPEYIMKVNMPAYWYSLKREADGLPDENGEMQGVSSVYRLWAVPAFAFEPTDGESDIQANLEGQSSSMGGK
ncbi:MAG: hypothetical protein CMK09_03765 [Ponticaulis sp.]|nr:hypothetical protein [Ponticaulis sp.]|tara:strand:+ start:2744 stop:3904 length:1161 start_codon:yes stop_codon:yes gene_type:complete